MVGANVSRHKSARLQGLSVILACVPFIHGQEMPYVMMHHEKNYTGNSRFYGFCVDLLAAVARVVGFSYRLELVPDRKYGARDPQTGEWNGIVRELMRHV